MAPVLQQKPCPQFMNLDYHRNEDFKLIQVFLKYSWFVIIQFKCWSIASLLHLS